MGLIGTLTPESVFSLTEAEQARRQKELAAAVAQTQQQLQQAQGAYQQAAQAPPPSLPLSDLFASPLLSGIASVLSGDKSYQQNAREEIRTKQSDLLKARSENLQALRDNAMQKAKEAEQAGDYEQAEKFRMNMEKLSKLHDQVLQKQRLDADRENLLIRERGDTERAKIAADARASTAAGTDWTQEDIDQVTESVLNGETEITAYPIRARKDIVTRARAMGKVILPKKARDTVGQITAARGVMSQIRELVTTVNTGGPRSRIAVGAAKSAGALTQTDTDASVYNSTRKGFLATLSRATGERGVLTDRDVARAEALLPNMFDSKTTAERKLKALGEFLNNLERNTFKNYTTDIANAPKTNDPLGIR